MINKVVRNGKVAVVYSPSYGSGWYTWHGKEELLFHPEIIGKIEENKRADITEEFCLNLLGDSVKDDIYCGGVEDLRIKWIEQGQEFELEEYDGSESITEIHREKYLKA